MSNLLNRIEQDINGSFKNDSCRLDDAKKNLHYYQGKFEPYWPAGEEGERCPRRTNVLLQHVTNQICTVNKEQPTRVVNGSDAATEFLQGVYKDNRMWAKLLDAEKLSCVSEVAAFQVAGTPDKDHPIKIHLWDASSLIVYTSPDDPTEPIGVVTVDCQGEDKRYQVWTDKDYMEIVQHPNKEGEVLPRKPEVVQQIPNPYGCLPFAFAHWIAPTLGFWSGSPGNNLVVANDYVNRRLSKMGAAQEFLNEPAMLLFNAEHGFTMDRLRPGDIKVVPQSVNDEASEDNQTRLEFVQPDYTFSECGWNDLISYIDLTLESHGIPLSATRMVQSTGRSGVSIQMEQWPLAAARKSRQTLWKDIEHQLAVVVFKVAAAHLKNKLWREIASNLDLTVSYPEVFVEVPGPERDRANEWELKVGMKSLIQLYMERNGVTKAEAEAHLQQVAEDNAKAELWGLSPATVNAQEQAQEQADAPEAEDVEDIEDTQEEEDD